jgi:enoyl-CoA hydratase/carnithine racemase
MPTPFVTITRSGGILDVELNRREKKNALTADMYADLTGALQEADADADIRVVFIHGQSDLFTAGNDVADFLDPAIRERWEAPRFIRTIAVTRTPIVAGVGGLAIGVGATMLLHCDLVVAADDARFQFPFVSLGLCPEAGSSLLLPQLAGHRVAAEMMMLGEMFGAAEAKAAGMVNRVVTASDVLSVARTCAVRLAAQPHDALLATKALLRRPLGRSASEAIEEELPEFGRLLASDTARSIFTSFLNKRRDG